MAKEIQISKEDALIGLSMMSQLFGDEMDKSLIADAEGLYKNSREFLRSSLLAATLCLQKFSAETDVPVSDIITLVREALLSGDMTAE